jgi:hypothetical protein
MSILSSVTSVLEPIKTLGIPSEECKPTKCDDRGDDKQKGREESKNDCEKQAKNDDHRDDREKQAKNDDHRDDREKQVKNDDHKDDHEKQAKDDDHSKHAKNDCQPHKDDCQPQKDHCDTKPSDDCGKANIYHSPGEALAKFDFAHSDLSSHAPDHSDMQGALAAMSPGHALDYAIGQMGPADHLDVGHFDVSHDVSHDTVQHG